MSSSTHNATDRMQKVIFHLEAFVAKFMRLVERYVNTDTQVRLHALMLY